MGHSQTIMSWPSLDAKMILSYTTEYLEDEMHFKTYQVSKDICISKIFNFSNCFPRNIYYFNITVISTVVKIYIFFRSVNFPKSISRIPMLKQTCMYSYRHTPEPDLLVKR